MLTMLWLALSVRHGVPLYGTGAAGLFAHSVPVYATGAA